MDNPLKRVAGLQDGQKNEVRDPKGYAALISTDDFKSLNDTEITNQTVLRASEEFAHFIGVFFAEVTRRFYLIR